MRRCRGRSCPTTLVAAFHRVFAGAGRGPFPRRALDGLRFAPLRVRRSSTRAVRCPACTTHVAVAGRDRTARCGSPTSRSPTSRPRPGSSAAQPSPARLRCGSTGDALCPPVRARHRADRRRARGADPRVGRALARRRVLSRGRATPSASCSARIAAGSTIGSRCRRSAARWSHAHARDRRPTARGCGWTTAFAGRLATTWSRSPPTASVIATHTSDGDDWLAGIAGACAAGDVCSSRPTTASCGSRSSAGARSCRPARSPIPRRGRRRRRAPSRAGRHST